MRIPLGLRWDVERGNVEIVLDLYGGHYVSSVIRRWSRTTVSRIASACTELSHLSAKECTNSLGQKLVGSTEVASLNDVEGTRYDKRRLRMNGATSGARCELKRLETRSLAEEQTSQHERRKRTTAHVPRPPIPPPIPKHHRRLADHPNPPRQRGRLKSRSKSVSNPRRTYQVVQKRRD